MCLSRRLFDNPIEYEVFLTLRILFWKKKLYLLADNDCDAGRWWDAVLGRPRVDWVTESDASGFVSCPFDIVDGTDVGVRGEDK